MSKTSPAQFVRQVRQELKRITWATKRDTMFATITVLLMAISNTVIVANIVSLLVAQVILFNSCLTCRTNCAGLVLDISILPKRLSIYLFF